MFQYVAYTWPQTWTTLRASFPKSQGATKTVVVDAWKSWLVFLNVQNRLKKSDLSFFFSWLLLKCRGGSGATWGQSYSSVCVTARMASSGSRAGSLRMDVAVLSWRSVLSTTERQKKIKNLELCICKDWLRPGRRHSSECRAFCQIEISEIKGDRTTWWHDILKSSLLTSEVQLTAQPSGSGPYNGILKYTSTCSSTCRLPGDVKPVQKTNRWRYNL